MRLPPRFLLRVTDAGYFFVTKPLLDILLVAFYFKFNLPV